MSETSCAWMRQTAAMSGMEVKTPVNPAGMESDVLTVAAFRAACLIRTSARLSGLLFGQRSESGISVIRLNTIELNISWMDSFFLSLYSLKFNMGLAPFFSYFKNILTIPARFWGILY